MKILIGALLAESNAYVKQDREIQDFTILKGPGMADKLYISGAGPGKRRRADPFRSCQPHGGRGRRFRYVRLSAEEVYPGRQGS